MLNQLSYIEHEKSLIPQGQIRTDRMWSLSGSKPFETDSVPEGIFEMKKLILKINQ